VTAGALRRSIGAARATPAFSRTPGAFASAEGHPYADSVFSTRGRLARRVDDNNTDA